MAATNEQENSPYPFIFQLDKRHPLVVDDEDSLVQTTFQLDYLKQRENINMQKCSNHCLDLSMQTLRTQSQLNSQEQNCLSSCFSKLTTASDIFFIQQTKMGQALSKRQIKPKDASEFYASIMVEKLDLIQDNWERMSPE